MHDTHLLPKRIIIYSITKGNYKLLFEDKAHIKPLNYFAAIPKNKLDHFLNTLTWQLNKKTA